MNAPLNNASLSADIAASGSLEIPLVPAGHDGRASSECVLQIISDLKHFYRRRNFSHLERFGAPDPLSEAALEELGNAYDNAKQLMDQAHDSDAPSINLKLFCA